MTRDNEKKNKDIKCNKKKAKKEINKETSKDTTPPMSPTTRAKLIAAPRKEPLKSSTDNEIHLPLSVIPSLPVIHLRQGDFWTFGKVVFCTYCDAKLNIQPSDVTDNPHQCFDLAVPHLCPRVSD